MFQHRVYSDFKITTDAHLTSCMAFSQLCTIDVAHCDIFSMTYLFSSQLQQQLASYRFNYSLGQNLGGFYCCTTTQAFKNICINVNNVLQSVYLVV